MKKLIPLLIWGGLLVAWIAMKIPRNQIIYCQAEVTMIILFVMGYRAGVKKWRSLPEKTVEARYVKQRYGYDKEWPDRRVSVATYAYELDGKPHKVRLQRLNVGFPDTVTLYYRKGKTDLHLRDNDDIPTYYRLFWTLLICPGSAIIVVLVLYYVLKIPIDF